MSCRAFYLRAVLIMVAGIGVVLAGARAVVADPPLTDEAVKANMAAKLATEQRFASALQAARNAPQPSGDPNRGAGVPIGPASALPTGIFTQGQPPFPAQQYALTSFWRGVVGAEYVTAYAGALSADPSQGIVVVITLAVKDLGAGSPGGEFRLPSRIGSLRIDSANGTLLHLVAPNGAAFTFDAALRIFSSAHGSAASSRGH